MKERRKGRRYATERKMSYEERESARYVFEGPNEHLHSHSQSSRKRKASNEEAAGM